MSSAERFRNIEPQDPSENNFYPLMRSSLFTEDEA